VETWSISFVGVPENHKVILTVPDHKKQIGCRPDGTLYGHENKLEWEQWKIVPVANGKVLISHHTHAGKNLGAKPDDSVYTHSNALEWEQWDVVHASGDRIHFRSHHGKHLGMKPDGTIYTHANHQGWETWHVQGL